MVHHARCVSKLSTLRQVDAARFGCDDRALDRHPAAFHRSRLTHGANDQIRMRRAIRHDPTTRNVRTLPCPSTRTHSTACASNAAPSPLARGPSPLYKWFVVGVLVLAVAAACMHCCATTPSKWRQPRPCHFVERRWRRRGGAQCVRIRRRAAPGHGVVESHRQGRRSADRGRHGGQGRPAARAAGRHDDQPDLRARRSASSMRRARIWRKSRCASPKRNATCAAPSSCARTSWSANCSSTSAVRSRQRCKRGWKR